MGFNSNLDFHLVSDHGFVKGWGEPDMMSTDIADIYIEAAERKSKNTTIFCGKNFKMAFFNRKPDITGELIDLSQDGEIEVA